MNISLLKKKIQSSLRHNKKIMALIRHAERYPIERGTFGENVFLTSQGRKTAKQLGKTFANIPTFKIHCSPLLRCIQTAQEIIKGAGKSALTYETTMFLGNPGPFIEDSGKAGPVFLSIALLEIAKAIATGEKISGMRNFVSGSKLFLDYALKIETPVLLMISHDVIIALLCSFLFEDRSIEKYMCDPLEGFFIERDENGLTVYYRKNIRCLSWKKLEEMLNYSS